MDHCVLLAPAKINLYLEIIGDRPDGFHELVMVMQTVALSDRIRLSRLSSDTIQLRCTHPEVPSDATNLAHRAADLMQHKFPKASARNGGLGIEIEKNIPVGAGLAGGSTDAAAVLVGINRLWQLGLTQSELEILGSELGSDVPFCIGGGTAIATGRGEKVSPLPDLQGLHVVLAKYRNLSVSTPWAYKTYRSQFEAGYVREPASVLARQERVRSGPMVAAISAQATQGPADGQPLSHNLATPIAQLLYNSLEKVVLPEHPQVQSLRDACTTCPEALGAMMSGSGPTVFALTQTEADAEAVQATVVARIDDPNLVLWTTPLSSMGIQLETSPDLL